MEQGLTSYGNVETLPRFIRHLRNLRCCDGDAITLECHVEALPDPFIIWEKDGKVLQNNKDFIMTYDGKKANLSIPRVYPEDEGEYTCVAKNTIGRTLSSACIIVDVPEEKENHLSSRLSRPMGLMSSTSTPISTPRSTPCRSFSPMPLSYRASNIDISGVSSRQRAALQRQAVSAPKFLTIPYNRVVEEGDSVRFQCAIKGNPTPWSTWDKDGMIATPTTRISIKEIDELRSLEIEEVTFEDAGLYRITLENDFGRIEATARLDVIKSSRYSKSPSARSVRSSSSKRNAYLHRRIMGPSTAIGGRMALAASFRGSSVPACKFYHNGIEIQEDERTHIETFDSDVVLMVDNVTKEDEGFYSCIIQEKDQEPLVSSTLVSFTSLSEHLKHKNTKQKPRIVKPLPSNTETFDGETVDLCFELESNDPYSYVWMRNGEILCDSEEFSYIDHGNGILCLRIHDAFDIDSGEYECKVTTSSGLSCSTKGELIIKPLCYDFDTSIDILKSPLPLICSVGSKAGFLARVLPIEAEVTWFVCGRNASTYPTEFTLESSSADGLHTLQINEVQLQHCGEIQLSITHPGKAAPTYRTYTSLIVFPQNNTNLHFTTAQQKGEDIEERQYQQYNYLPCILSAPKDCTALIGGSVTLNVTYKEIQVPQVNWFKGTRPLTGSGANVSIETTSTSSTLRITEIAADDSGKYSVEVMNEYGAEVSSASVAVEGPPDPPSGKPCISQGSDRVSIAWCGPPYDGGCMIKGFIIEKQERGSDQLDFTSDWQEVATVSDSLAYTLKDCKPGMTLRFRVRARNIHGLSEPGHPSDLVTISQPQISTEDCVHPPVSVRSGGDFKTRFEIIDELGKGRFGTVYKVQEKENPRQILAAKVIKCIKSQDRRKVQEEISIMKSLQHPKLLQLAASFESPREIVMVMEYITGGELFERVVADDFTLTELDCILFIRQVCEGVAYMHSRSVVHLDLKPENIMCHTRTSHQIKIIDFGLAQRLDSDSPVRVLFGTPEFIPPEIISYEPIGFQSDMWSIGVICYVLLSGLSPFMGDSDVDTFSNITRADYDFDDEAFDCVSQEAKDFISNLLIHRKEDRLTAEQCLESKWLTQRHDENLSTNKICTDKLKKFIIRRKWQKTGNAIRALGRMVTLSASRRNSAVSALGSIPTSPRPSISGISLFNPNIHNQMSSLHEEDDSFTTELSIQEVNKLANKPLRIRDKSHCSERSDSGYSECSNCSGGLNSNLCSCSANSYKLNERASTTEHLTPSIGTESFLSISVPHDLLKSKLNEIAKQTFRNTKKIEKTSLMIDKAKSTEKRPPLRTPEDQADKGNTLNKSLPKIFTNKIVYDTNSSKITPTKPKEPILRSDFTYTIKMRKKSLENNAAREKPKQLPKQPYDIAGKVSMLKSKFSQNESLPIDHSSKSLYHDNICMPPNNSKNVTSRFLRTNNRDFPNQASQQQTRSLPASPILSRSSLSSRLKANKFSSNCATGAFKESSS